MLLNFSATTEDFVPLSVETDSPKPVAKPVSQTSRRKTTQPKRRTTKVVETKQAPQPKAAVKTAPTPRVVAIPPNASVELAESMADDPKSGVTARMFREWYEAHAVKTPRQKKASVPVSDFEVTDKGRVKHTLKGEKAATSKHGETVDRMLKRIDPQEIVFLVQQLTAELCSDEPITTEICAGRNGDYERSTCGAVGVPSGEARQKQMFDRLEACQLMAEMLVKSGLAS